MKHHHVLVTSTRHGHWNCYYRGMLIAEGTRTPFRDSARALITDGYSKDGEDAVVLKLSGASGSSHEAVVKPVAGLAGRDWLKTALAPPAMRIPDWPPPG